MTNGGGSARLWRLVFRLRLLGTRARGWLRGETNTRSKAAGTGQQFKRRLLRELLGRVDRFLYIGEANQQFYLEQGVAKEQLAPAPYCVDNARFATAAAAAARLVSTI